MTELIANPDGRIHPSTYIFAKSLSPHIAARMDGAEIELQRFKVPETSQPLVIELAGGVAVPLNDQHTNLDLLSEWRYPVVLVSRHYLGSINHTLLTVEALQRRDIPIAGIVCNGEQLPDTERIIERLSGCTIVGRIPWQSTVTRQAISALASERAIELS
jgi:dethiobiotin synthetase